MDYPNSYPPQQSNHDFSFIHPENKGRKSLIPPNMSRNKPVLILIFIVFLGIIIIAAMVVLSFFKRDYSDVLKVKSIQNSLIEITENAKAKSQNISTRSESSILEAAVVSSQAEVDSFITKHGLTKETVPKSSYSASIKKLSEIKGRDEYDTEYYKIRSKMLTEYKNAILELKDSDEASTQKKLIAAVEYLYDSEEDSVQ